ncbi:MAG: ABC transporter substrate-binding protein [Anaerolineae bacterium]|nr:ABC transporter substrate-binding protein [Anaerolineae bacterium]
MRKVSLLLVVAMVLALVPTVSISAQGGNTFVFGEFGNAVQLDPAVVTDGISFRVTVQGCEALLFYDGSTTNPVPGLAKSWTVSDDGLVWAFQLEEGVMFHDGTPFNAEAVKWNFDRWRLTSHPQHFAESVFEYYDYMWNGFDEGSLIQSVEATGEYEVTITLAEPYGSMLNTLAMPMFAIASPAAVEAAGAAYGTPEVGYSCTGPYKFVEWISDDHITLERNAEYWGEIPGNVDTIIYRIIPDAAARFAALQSGEIDAFEGPNVEDLDAIDAADDLFIQMRGPLNVMYLAFSYRVKEFRDPLVRQAIAMALNRQEIVDAFYPPGAVVATTMIPPSLWGFNPDVPAFEYDPEGAKALLAEAGYPDGLSEVTVLPVDENNMVIEDAAGEVIPLTLYFQPVQRPYNPDGEGIGEAMVSYLADIGLEAQLGSVGDWSAYLDARSNGELNGLYQLGWTGDNGDPDNFLGYFFGAGPKPAEGYYYNQEVHDLLMQARSMTAQAEREPIYQQVDAIMHDEVGRIYVAHTGVPLAFRSRVSGYVTNPLGTEHFKFVSVE